MNAHSNACVCRMAEVRDEKQLLRYQKRLANYKLPIIDELGLVPLSKTGAELLSEIFSQRYERGSTLVTSNLSESQLAGIGISLRNAGWPAMAVRKAFGRMLLQ